MFAGVVSFVKRLFGAGRPATINSDEADDDEDWMLVPATVGDCNGNVACRVDVTTPTHRYQRRCCRRHHHCEDHHRQAVPVCRRCGASLSAAADQPRRHRWTAASTSRPPRHRHGHGADAVCRCQNCSTSPRHRPTHPIHHRRVSTRLKAKNVRGNPSQSCGA